MPKKVQEKEHEEHEEHYEIEENEYLETGEDEGEYEGIEGVEEYAPDFYENLEIISEHESVQTGAEKPANW